MSNRDENAAIPDLYYLPDNYDPSIETEATIEAIHALNKEMIAAGVRKFACGLSPKAITLGAARR
ncbi:hypothetical protein [Dyella jejuensis]|uniref:hypothetical protein n=1 Tax=Dyella jejuensis TaxID=1432009 RepID=UPI00384F72FA